MNNNNQYIHIYLEEMQKGKGVKDAVKTVSALYDIKRKGASKEEDKTAHERVMAEAYEFYSFLIYFMENVLRNTEIIVDLYHESQKDPALSIIKDISEIRIKKHYAEDTKHMKKATDEQIQKLYALTDNLNNLCRQCKTIIFMESEEENYYLAFDHASDKDMIQNMLINAITDEAALIIMADDKIFGFSCDGFDLIPQTLDRRTLPFVLMMYGKEMQDNGMSDKLTPIDPSYMLIQR